MRAQFHVLLAILALTACTVPASQPWEGPPPPFVYSTLIWNDEGAIHEVFNAFGTPGSTRGNPVEALRAILCVEYLATEFNAPRWAEMSPITKMQMVQARDEIHRAIGLAPNAPPQVVFAALMRLQQDLQTGNMADARQVLAPPLFTLPPDETLRILADLPPLPSAHVAAVAAENAIVLPRG